jgi:hypothetical protein
VPNYLIRWCDERVEKVFTRKGPLQHLLRFHSVPDGTLDNSGDASVGLTAAQVYNFSTNRGGQPRLGSAKVVYRTKANPLPPPPALARRYQSCSAVVSGSYIPFNPPSLSPCVGSKSSGD